MLTVLLYVYSFTIYWCSVKMELAPTCSLSLTFRQMCSSYFTFFINWTAQIETIILNHRTDTDRETCPERTCRLQLSGPVCKQTAIMDQLCPGKYTQRHTHIVTHGLVLYTHSPIDTPI